jgi:hypothetical protein
VPNPASIRARNPEGSAEPPTNPRWTEVSEGLAASVAAGAARAGLGACDGDFAAVVEAGPVFTAPPPGTAGGAGKAKDWPEDQSIFGDLNPTTCADQKIAVLQRCPASILQSED